MTDYVIYGPNKNSGVTVNSELEGGTYYIILMAEDGRWAVLPIEITVEPSTFSINKTAYCVDESVNVSATSSYPGAWVGFYPYDQSGDEGLVNDLLCYYSVKDATPGTPVDILHNDSIVNGLENVADLGPGHYRVILFTKGYSVDQVDGRLAVRSFYINDHDYQDVEGTAVAATCTTAGKEANKKCSKCGDEVEGAVINALGHDLEATPEKAASCEDPGNSAYWTCQREGCGKFFSDANGQNEIEEDSWVIAATDHDYSGDWEKNDADTHKKVCANNSEHFITEAHSWNEGEVTTAPTLDAEGEMTFTCTKCQETKTEPIPALTADQYINEMIKDIWDKATLEDKDAVEAAVAAYEALGDKQADVTDVTKAKLDVAQERIAAAETQAAADAAAAQAAADQQAADDAAAQAAVDQQAANDAQKAADDAQKAADDAAAKAKRDQDAADDAAAKAAKAQEDANTAAAKAVEAQATADEAAAKAAEAQKAAEDAVAKAEAAQKAADEATAKAEADQKAAEEQIAAAEKAVADAQAAQKAAEERAAAAEAAAGSKEELEALRIENAQLKVQKQKVTGLKVKAQKKGKAVVSFKSLGEDYTYVISKSTKKNKGFKKAATTDTTKVMVKKGLKKGKTYYFKVRAYKNIGGKDIYTGYSKVVKVKAK